MNEGNKIPENPLMISWHDSAWIPVLNQANVMDYFSERSNPFYDRTCNNEVLKMQKLGVADVQLQNMQGTEYQLLHVQEPILYVIRKQIRHSSAQVTPVSDYYIVAGVVYQAPDLSSLLNSRILTTVSHLQSAFEEARSYSRYHPSRGYWWEFGKDNESEKKQKKKAKKNVAKDEPSSLFQRRRVDILLDQLTRQFPFKTLPAVEGPKVDQLKKESDLRSEKSGPTSGQPNNNNSNAAGNTGNNVNSAGNNEISANGSSGTEPVKAEPTTTGGGGSKRPANASGADKTDPKPDSKRMKLDR